MMRGNMAQAFIHTQTCHAGIHAMHVAYVPPESQAQTPAASGHDIASMQHASIAGQTCPWESRQEDLMSGGFQYIEGRYTTRGTQKSTEKPRRNVFLRMRPGGVSSGGPARRGSRGGHSLRVSPPGQTGLPHERREKISADTQHDNTQTHSSSTEQHGIPAQQTDTRPSLHREAGPFGVLRPPAARRTGRALSGCLQSPSCSTKQRHGPCRAQQA